MAVLPFIFMYWPAGQLGIEQVVSSFSTFVVKPFGQIAQESAAMNGFAYGFAMNFPAGQHPSRPFVPVAEEVLENARSHCPPHNVRLKPLPENTEKKGNRKKVGKRHM